MKTLGLTTLTALSALLVVAAADGLVRSKTIPREGGIGGYGDGEIADQTLLLQDIVDGLVVYNRNPDPTIDRLSEMTIRDVSRIAQAPKRFVPKADGVNADSSRMLHREVLCPLKNWDASSEFSVEFLQDALASDVMDELNGAMIGNAELQNYLFFKAMFTKMPVGAIGTAYQAGFYNGETDVPTFRNNVFKGTAHFHYLGLNHLTLTMADWQGMKKDLWEHGYGLSAGSLEAFINTAQVDDVEGLMNTNASNTILQAITAMRATAIDRGIVGTGIMLDGVLINVTDEVPAGYVAMVANDVKPLGKRQHRNPAYRGLQTYWDKGQQAQYPLANMKFMDRLGFGVRHLGAGTCRQLVNSANYTNPVFAYEAASY
jgi:hypothetical protein